MGFAQWASPLCVRPDGSADSGFVFGTTLLALSLGLHRRSISFQFVSSSSKILITDDLQLCKKIVENGCPMFLDDTESVDYLLLGRKLGPSQWDSPSI